ncbi:hypothetical protein C0416_03285 [bacterium]|nr:hypothetical protein [bacterium]
MVLNIVKLKAKTLHKLNRLLNFKLVLENLEREERGFTKSARTPFWNRCFLYYNDIGLINIIISI